MRRAPLARMLGSLPCPAATPWRRPTGRTTARRSDGRSKSSCKEIWLAAKSGATRRFWRRVSWWDPEGLIWPTWPGRSQEELAASVLPLTAVEEYWSAAGKRLRDSAKWMATVLGAALAVIVGTSPLSEMTQRINHRAALATGSAGLLFLFVTLFLVIQVMRPQSVSFTDVQFATENRGFWKKLFYGNPLYKWKTIIEKEPDLHLPCGVKSLTALRQAMIIEEITLVALSRATVKASDKPSRQSLCDAEAGRAARLLEMRIAATKTRLWESTTNYFSAAVGQLTVAQHLACSEQSASSLPS